MDFIDEIKLFADRVDKLKDQVTTEEGTKNAFIMPFIRTLGYDVFNPLEVVPEFVADIGIKKGEKVDYAILKDGEPAILVECKHWGEKLDPHNSQLFRYFHTTKAKFGLLSNGIVYRFYTDLVEPNKMDEKPFFEFNVLDIRDNQVDELRKFHRSYFDVGSIQNTASELKFLAELKVLVHDEFQEPTEAFVRHFAKQIYKNSLTSKLMEQFAGLTKKAIQQYINDLITDRLKAALNKEVAHVNIEQAADNKPINEPGLVGGESKVETTLEELEAYMIVKSVLRQHVKASRITYRDAQSYFAVFLDDNNRKPLCRLYFNGNRKFIGTFDEAKKETKTELLSMDDIYQQVDALVSVALSYDKERAGKVELPAG